MQTGLAGLAGIARRLRSGANGQGSGRGLSAAYHRSYNSPPQS